MNRRLLIKSGLLACTGAAVSGCGNLAQVAETGLGVSQALGYSPEKLSEGVKQILTLSTQRTSESLGGANGFMGASSYRIGLPQQFDSVVQPMRKFGLGSYVDSVENLMNQGAQRAAKEAGPVFVSAISKMNVTDALGILRGGPNAATQFFRSETEQTLRSRYQGIIKDQLTALGFYNDYKKLSSAYKLVPIANKPNLDLESHAIDSGINALFTQIAKEEGKIRANPVEQGNVLISSLLKS